MNINLNTVQKLFGSREDITEKEIMEQFCADVRAVKTFYIEHILWPAREANKITEKDWETALEKVRAYGVTE